jgi:hypothetical protein
MSYEVYDKKYGEETLKIIEGLLHDMSIWSGYNNDKFSDVITGLQETIASFRRTLEEDIEDN